MKNTLADYESWGRFPRVSHLGQLVPSGVDKVDSAIKSVNASILPRGMGRSYGDSCLNENGYLLSTKRLDRFYSFDEKTGALRCEAGVTLDEILKVFVPRGWFLPVTPGTKYVTIGGAIANDVHGKNHHKYGSFGHHVRQFELLRSNGERLICSRDTNHEWFRATIGGMGLTGLILWAEFTLKKIRGPYIEMESIKFEDIREFFTLSRESARDYEYTVSWIDCITRGSGTGRGIFMRGNHSDTEESIPDRTVHKDPTWKTFPFDAPSFFLSPASIKIFNAVYYNKQKDKFQRERVHYDPYFFPLDNIRNWNRMYGKRGFLQWQFVTPINSGVEPTVKVMEEIIKSRLGSFLVVAKEFGGMPNEGMMSFPMPGITITLDFPIVGERLFSLLDRLDDIVRSSGGRLYPAKDARMSERTFAASYPESDKFKGFIDPRFSSSFFRRVTGG